MSHSNVCEATNTFTPPAGKSAKTGVQLLVTPPVVCPLCREPFKLGDCVSLSPAFAFARGGAWPNFRILKRGEKTWWMTCTRETCVDLITLKPRAADGIWNGDVTEHQRNRVLLKLDPKRPEVFAELAGETALRSGRQGLMVNLE